MWIAQRLVSSNRPTRYASAAFYRASMVTLWNHMSNLKSWAIFQMSLWNGNFWMRSLVTLWYQWISWKVMVPGLNCHGWEAASTPGACLPPHKCEVGPLNPSLVDFLHFSSHAHFCCFWVSIHLACLAHWALAKKEPRGLSQLNWGWPSWTCCLAKSLCSLSSKFRMSTLFSLGEFLCHF